MLTSSPLRNKIESINQSFSLQSISLSLSASLPVCASLCVSVSLCVPLCMPLAVSLCVHRVYARLLAVRAQILILMYIYHALINALSAHTIHINLNMIFCTHVEHSPTKTIYIKYYKNK